MPFSWQRSRTRRASFGGSCPMTTTVEPPPGQPQAGLGRPSRAGQRNVISGVRKVALRHDPAIGLLPRRMRNRASRDYLVLSIYTLTCGVRTLKGISEVRVILSLNLMEALHGANIRNSPIGP